VAAGGCAADAGAVEEPGTLGDLACSRTAAVDLPASYSDGRRPDVFCSGGEVGFAEGLGERSTIDSWRFERPIFVLGSGVT